MYIGRSMKWKTISIIVIAVCVILSLYVGTWCFRKQIGVVQPMANLRYFCYSPGPETWQDRTLYVVYFPLYRTSIAIQDWGDEGRTDVHWSDRRYPVLPGPRPTGFEQSHSGDC
jgi:hypothetical protein